eukprot:CAMPEP_0178408816 /NCGR_PEP_ID=MMETSP0689_2-20121128/20137_1 /TAXON_ID=160604 /ORGANISM="Amphidinium massartii, Strain CS-259" /LENGTH=307 /DNA_ID=CAMNT_0020029929 /DNA_START=41 /DNA_END=964 /DNA_ORIENTATION=-
MPEVRTEHVRRRLLVTTGIAMVACLHAFQTTSFAGASYESLPGASHCRRKGSGEEQEAKPVQAPKVIRRASKPRGPRRGVQAKAPRAARPAVAKREEEPKKARRAAHVERRPVAPRTRPPLYPTQQRVKRSAPARKMPPVRGSPAPPLHYRELWLKAELYAAKLQDELENVKKELEAQRAAAHWAELHAKLDDFFVLDEEAAPAKAAADPAMMELELEVARQLEPELFRAQAELLEERKRSEALHAQLQAQEMALRAQAMKRRALQLVVMLREQGEQTSASEAKETEERMWWQAIQRSYSRRGLSEK